MGLHLFVFLQSIASLTACLSLVQENGEILSLGYILSLHYTVGHSNGKQNEVF